MLGLFHVFGKRSRVQAYILYHNVFLKVRQIARIALIRCDKIGSTAKPVSCNSIEAEPGPQRPFRNVDAAIDIAGVYSIATLFNVGAVASQ
jgi:hypothetical protein